MAERNVVAEIVERRKIDIQSRGYTFGVDIPRERTRKINPFMEERGAILEVKRASPSKGDIAPGLDPAETAMRYAENGAAAISCLTEENYFKGSLRDLIAVCEAVPDVPVLRKDFLLDEEEIDIAYRCGADAVLLISGILSLEKMISMTRRCCELGIRALVEVRTDDDADKVLEVKKIFPDTVVCGVNSRNLRDFTIDPLVPAMLKEKLGGKVIFESGITTPDSARKVGSMGFSGILLGEFAARNPMLAGEFVKAFKAATEDSSGRKWVELAGIVGKKNRRPLVKICGLTRPGDVELADKLEADMVGFVFANGFGRNVHGERFEKIKPILPSIRALKVAVVTDPESEEARDAAKLVESGVLDFIQLHGIGYGDVPEHLSRIPHYFALTGERLEEGASNLMAKGEPRFLQDCRDHIYGTSEHLWMAGALTADNIGALVERFHPELVDVSSGIEDDIVGEKNAGKMKKFFEMISKE